VGNPFWPAWFGQFLAIAIVFGAIAIVLLWIPSRWARIEAFAEERTNALGFSLLGAIAIAMVRYSQTKMDRLGENDNELGRGVAALETNMDNVRRDVARLETNVQNVRGDIADLKTDLNTTIEKALKNYNTNTDTKLNAMDKKVDMGVTATQALATTAENYIKKSLASTGTT